MFEMKIKVKGGLFLLKKIFMYYVYIFEDLMDEYCMIVQIVKQFIEKEVDFYYNDIEQQDFNKVVELMYKVGEFGFFVYSISEVYGGLGFDKVSKGFVGEIIGWISGYGVVYFNYICIVIFFIMYFGIKE